MAERIARMRAWAEQFGFVSRHLRALDRANGLRFTRWAAGIALFGYLSLFPLVVLAFIAFGVVLSNLPDLQTEVEDFLRSALPLLFDPQTQDQPVDIEKIATVTTNAGIISVIGLLIAGLGWVDSTMEGVRRMQGAMRRPRSWLLLRLQDTGALLLMGTILLVALVGAVILETFGTSALTWLGVNEESTWLVQLSAILILGLLVWIVVVALYGIAWWNRPHRRWRTVMLGALYTTALLVLLT
ncbi:MAG: YihY/virulence factor BrkB family protein, partial [Actinomycetes bacterium]